MGGAGAFSEPDTGWRMMLHTIRSDAEAHGRISPTGTVSVRHGESQAFAVLPDANFHVADVLVDGVSAGPLSQYVFTNIVENHTIRASFVTNIPPMIGLAVSPVIGSATLRVEFDFSGSFDPDGIISRCGVDKTGDGVFDIEGNGTAKIMVEYAEPGVFQAQARVFDNDGAVASTSVTITVLGTGPVADLEVIPDNGDAPLTVSLIGTNSTAGAGHHIQKYLFDFNGDGVYDCMSTTGMVTWTYRGAGTNMATLTVVDDMGLQARDSVLVTVRPAPMPPPIVTLSAAPASGTKPLNVVFTANATGGGSISSYQWDLNCDGSYELQTVYPVVTGLYQKVGTFLPRVTAMAESGLTGSGCVTVQVSKASGLRTWIMPPKDGAHIWGNAVSLMGHAESASRVTQVQYQYKRSDTNVWQNLGSAFIPPPSAYDLTWDVTTLSQADYDLRTVATDEGGGMATSEVVKVTVDPDAGWNVGGTSEGQHGGAGVRKAGVHQKMSTFSVNETADLEVYDRTGMSVPMGTVERDITVVVELTGANTHAASGAAWNKVSIDANRTVAIEGAPELMKPVTLDIPYPDADDNGFVDGTAVDETSLEAFVYDGLSGEWKKALSSEVHARENYVRATLSSLGEVGLFGGSVVSVAGDYDGDQKSDMAVFDSDTGAWYVRSLAGALITWATAWGCPDTLPVAGDYDGDGLSDLCIFDSTFGVWFVMSADSRTLIAWGVAWGWPGAVPVPGDYNGDMKSDYAVFDNNTGNWFVLSANQATVLTWAVAWGWPGAVPVSGDYDGDRKSDYAVFDGNTGNWFVLASDQATILAWNVAWGWPGAISVPGDYDADGRSDFAVFDSPTGNWYVLSSDTITLLAWARPWGWPGAVPVPGDYDGDGNSDLAVFDSNTGAWYIQMIDGSLIAWAQNWGWPGCTVVGGRE